MAAYPLIGGQAWVVSCPVFVVGSTVAEFIATVERLSSKGVPA
jgi:hypothetical protein